MAASESASPMTMEDYTAVSGLLFDWADSYNAKDWERLRGIVTPELLVDYTNVSGQKWEAMKADEYVALMSSPGWLGDPLLQTQHLIGMSRWEKPEEDLIVGHHQVRAAHLRYADETRAVQEMAGHSHSTNLHYYRRVDGQWKFAGLKPTVRWNEDDFERVFSGFQAPRRT